MTDVQSCDTLTRRGNIVGEEKRLDLGAGLDRSWDAVTVDMCAETRPDIVHDLNVRPWPLPDDHFVEVHCRDVLEHLDDVIGALEEIHRVSRAGGMVYITTPHYTSRNSFTDPTHTRHFGLRSFDYVTVGASADIARWDFYTKARFRKQRQQLHFEGGIGARTLSWAANKWPDLWEQRFSWMLPAWYFSVDLEVVK